MTVRGLTHHLVAYFDIRDLMSNELLRPSSDLNLAGIEPRAELLSQGFTAPIEQDDEVDIFCALRP